MSRRLDSKTERLLRATADDHSSRSDHSDGPGAARISSEPAEQTNRDPLSITINASASALTDPRSDWQFQLASKHPHFFCLHPLETEFGCKMQCGYGWCDIIERACVRIAAVLVDREQFRFEEIRERNGELRMYWGGWLTARSEAAVRYAIDLAQARSVCICEVCGDTGRLRRDGDVRKTCCDLHAQGEAVPVRSGFENLHLAQKWIVGRQWTMVIRRYDPESDDFTDLDPADAEKY
jgi:hypothetical protein